MGMRERERERERERDGCFALTVFLVSCDSLSVMWLFLAVPWVCLRCVIVAFPDHIHLFFFNMKYD